MATKILIGVLAFAAGVYTGVEIAKAYAENKIQSGADSFLGKIGLGGSPVQTFVDQTVVPGVVN